MSTFPLFLNLFFLLTCWGTLFSCSQQLPISQSQSLFRLRRILEYASPVATWNRLTPFCSFPASSSVNISCSASGQITVLSIAGDRHASLSPNFSSKSLFSDLSKLSSLTSLSLVSLGIWGSLPSAITALSSLRVLNLSTNRLSGPLPDLKSLRFLTHLDLSANLIGPDFPSLGKDIVALHLQNNTFRAQQLFSFARLQSLDLSFNQFSGKIPPFLFSLPSITYLNLSANKFKGPLSKNIACGAHLRFIDLSRNLLSGTLPSCIRSNRSNLLVMDSWNCLSEVDSRYQHAKSFCTVQPLAAVLPLAVNESGTSKKANLGLVLTLVGGVIGALVLLAGLLLFFLLFKKKRSENNVTKSLCKPAKGRNSIQHLQKTLADTRHMSHAVIIGTMGLTPYRIFTMEELDEATNGFDSSNLVSEGPQGQFFKGWLGDGSSVLVRRLQSKQKNSSQSILQYMDIISKIRHRHIISILGHCIVSGQENASMPSAAIVLLVFEYVSNGTLRSHLTEWRKREMLKWPQRINAVIGIARGMQFLHTFMTPGIVSNDLHIDNILLDETLTAKISNYKLPSLPTNKINTVGCESPFGEECHIGSISNVEYAEKEDIYQLGLILLEVITGKPAGLQGELDALKSQLQKSLNESPLRIGAVADAAILNTFAHESLRTAVTIALNCVAGDPRERPSLDDVLWNLQYCAQIQTGWTSSESLSAFLT